MKVSLLLLFSIALVSIAATAVHAAESDVDPLKAARDYDAGQPGLRKTTAKATFKKAKIEYPFQDFTLPFDQRIDDLVTRLTLQEKIGLLGDATIMTVPRLNIGQPIKQLKAFARVHLRKGEKQTIAISAPVKDWALWDVKTHAFVVDRGRFDVLVGASSEDIRLRDTVSVR